MGDCFKYFAFSYLILDQDTPYGSPKGELPDMAHFPTTNECRGFQCYSVHSQSLMDEKHQFLPCECTSVGQWLAVGNEPEPRAGFLLQGSRRNDWIQALPNKMFQVLHAQIFSMVLCFLFIVTSITPKEERCGRVMNNDVAGRL